MKFATPLLITPLLTLLVGGTGCDHLARYYQAATKPIPGPVSTNGGFVTRSHGLPIYHSLPGQPYYIIGRFDRAITLNRIPTAARYYGADFIFVDEHNTDFTIQDPGLLLFNNNVGVALPGATHHEERLTGIIYLAITNLANWKPK